MQFLIGGIKKTSLLDYPGKIAAIVFTKGCNFNCGYCHNPSLLSACKCEEKYSPEYFFDYIQKRRGLLDAVVISGGEPTLQKDLPFFAERIKNLGFLIKLDTNGSSPDVVKTLVLSGLVDYVAMDIKAPIEKYSQIIRVNIDTQKISESINFIINSGVDYEFRTTVLKNMLSVDDFVKIAEMISGAKQYYLQKFEVKSDINDNSLINEVSYSNEEFMQIAELLKKSIQNVELR